MAQQVFKLYTSDLYVIAYSVSTLLELTIDRVM